MQSKQVEAKFLKSHFQSYLNFNRELSIKDLSVRKILSNEPLEFYFYDSIKGSYQHEVKNKFPMNVKSICLNEVLNILTERLDSLKLLIDEQLNNKFRQITKFFRNNDEIYSLISEQSQIQKLIANPSEIEKNILVEVNLIDQNTLYSIPFNTLEYGQNVYIVTQSFNSYLEIKKYQVSDIIIINTQNDSEFNTDFEFNYYLKNVDNNELIEISYYNFRNFDGNKANINNGFLFIDLEAAKEHCILSLNNLKNTIVDKIKEIQNYEK